MYDEKSKLIINNVNYKKKKGNPENVYKYIS